MEGGIAERGRDRQTLQSLTPHKMTRESNSQSVVFLKFPRSPELLSPSRLSFPFSRLLPFKLLRWMRLRCDMQHRRKKCEVFWAPNL